MGLWLSIAFGALTYPLFWWSESILLALGQRPEVASLGQDFLRVAGLGMIPALLVMALKSYLAALERTQVVLVDHHRRGAGEWRDGLCLDLWPLRRAGAGRRRRRLSRH